MEIAVTFITGLLVGVAVGAALALLLYSSIDKQGKRYERPV